MFRRVVFDVVLLIMPLNSMAMTHKWKHVTQFWNGVVLEKYNFYVVRQSFHKLASRKCINALLASYSRDGSAFSNSCSSSHLYTAGSSNSQLKFLRCAGGHIATTKPLTASSSCVSHFQSRRCTPDLLQVQHKHITNGLARTACFINFWFFFKLALHGWFISTSLSIYLALRCGLSSSLRYRLPLVSFRYVSQLNGKQHRYVFVFRYLNLYKFFIVKCICLHEFTPFYFSCFTWSTRKTMINKLTSEPKKEEATFPSSTYCMFYGCSCLI